MSRKSLCLLALLLLQGPMAQADPERRWVWNLGNRTETLLLKVSQDFDPSALEIDVRGEVRREKVGQKTHVRVVRPTWARELLSMAAGNARLGPGKTAEAPAIAGPDGRVRLAVGFEEESAVTVTIQDEQGAVVRSFSASSTVPVRWRIDLGSAEELTGARLLLRVDRGTVVAGIPAPEAASGSRGLRSITAAATICNAWFSQTVNYSGSLYYYVAGCPPSTCGTLHTYRNGGWQSTPGWLCTDSSGNSTKGPWYWSNFPNDQTDEPAYIEWPSGDKTTDAVHIFDKNYAITYRDSPWGAPPTTYYGHATDTQWGTGFDFGGTCWSDFIDLTPSPDLWWNPATGTYSSTTYKYVTNTTSRVNRWYINWSGPFPSSGSHVSGHTYEWYTCCHDGGGGQCVSGQFTVP